MQSVRGQYAQSFLGQREIMQCVDDRCEVIQPETQSLVQSVMQSVFLCAAAQSIQRCQVLMPSVQRLVISDQACVGRCVMNSVSLSGVRSRDTNKWECWKYDFQKECWNPEISAMFISGFNEQ